MNEFDKKMMKIKKIVESMSPQEKLRYELDRQPLEANDIGKIISELTKGKSPKKLAEELGIAEDWLNYYLQHLSLNEPTKAEPIKAVQNEPIQLAKDFKEDFQRYRVRKKR